MVKFGDLHCFFRGMVHIHSQDWDRALRDLNTAKEKNFDIVTQFHERFDCITELEGELNFTLRDDVKIVLSNHESEVSCE